MKKILGSLILVLGALFFLFPSANSYELSDADYDVIDKLDERVITLIDSRENLTAQKVVDVFENFLEKRKTPVRFQTIIKTVIDDIEYEYYLGEYSETGISAEDCYDDEYFDETEGVCYLNDSSGDEEEQVEQDLINGEGEAKSEETMGDEEILAEYTINENEIKLVSGKDDDEYQKVWTLFSSLIPKEYRQDIATYKVYKNEESDTGAYVDQQEDPKKWNLVINLVSLYNEDGDFDKEASAELLIHEFAHVLSLGKTQVKHTPLDASEALVATLEDNCKAYYLGEGCLKSESYLNGFISKFWKQDFEASQSGEENDFYSGKESNYVTDYAATNPGEDIAESFAYFVLQAKPASNEISDQKMRYFYDFPELVKLRDFIRMRLQK